MEKKYYDSPRARLISLRALEFLTEGEDGEIGGDPSATIGTGTWNQGG